jgi:ribosomal protein L37E
MRSWNHNSRDIWRVKWRQVARDSTRVERRNCSACWKWRQNGCPEHVTSRIPFWFMIKDVTNLVCELLQANSFLPIHFVKKNTQISVWTSQNAYQLFCQGCGKRNFHICLKVKCGFFADHMNSLKVAAKWRKHQVWYTLTDGRDQTQPLTVKIRAVGNCSTWLFPRDKECTVVCTLVLVPSLADGSVIAHMISELIR